jgi:hypothetical protein
MESYDEGVEINYIPPSAIEEIVLQAKDDENAFIEQTQLAIEDLSPFYTFVMSKERRNMNTVEYLLELELKCQVNRLL